MAKCWKKSVIEVLIFLCAQIILRVLGAEKCRCDYENDIINCSRLQLTDISQNELQCGRVFSSIDLSENNLETFPDELHEFKTVNLYRNYLEHLDTLNSQEVNNLQVSANILTKIDLGNNFLSLRHLNVSWNKLADENFLLGNCNVEILDISHNRITSLQSATRCVSLRFLLGTRNMITNLPNNFSALTKLEILDLTLNKLATISGLPVSLRTLNLADNILTKVHDTSFKGLASLRMLQLSGNKISNLKAGAFSSLSTLETLLLSDNKLKMIKDQSFEGLKSLKTIRLTSNDIESLTDYAFSELPALEILDLDKNLLTTLPALRFGSKVSRVSLSFNFIQKMNVSALQTMFSGSAVERLVFIPFNLIRGDDSEWQKIMGVFDWECFLKIPINLVTNLQSRYRNHKLANSECPCIKVFMKEQWTLAVCISDAEELNGVPWYRAADVSAARDATKENTDYYFQYTRKEL